MDWNSLIEAATHQGIWCLFFCYLFFTTQKQAENRENLLIEKLTDYNDSLQKISETIERINDRLLIVEEKILN